MLPQSGKKSAAPPRARENATVGRIAGNSRKGQRGDRNRGHLVRKQAAKSCRNIGDDAIVTEARTVLTMNMEHLFRISTKHN
jgi:hypothetical protein